MPDNPYAEAVEAAARAMLPSKCLGKRLREALDALEWGGDRG